jgi:hypothetical protein
MANFGEVPISAELLVEELVLRVCPKVTSSSGDGMWTQAVKEVLADLGRNRGFLSQPGKLADEETSQFLLDFIWWKNREDNDIVLAVESEWGNDRKVCEDFGKLLVIKAPLKLLVFGTKSQPHGTEVMHKLKRDYLAKFAGYLFGEKYVFLDFCVPEGVTRAYTFSPNGPGKPTEVNLAPLPNLPIRLSNEPAIAASSLGTGI